MINDDSFKVCRGCGEPTKKIANSAWDRKNGSHYDYKCKNMRCDIHLRTVIREQKEEDVQRIHSYNEAHGIDIARIRAFIQEDKRKVYLSKHTGLTNLCLVYMAVEQVGIKPSTYEDIITAIEAYKPRKRKAAAVSGRADSPLSQPTGAANGRAKEPVKTGTKTRTR